MKRVQTATTGTVRDINRSILLNLVRVEQPISRAELSRRTGMFRSNVSKIVDDLVREGMLTEERPLPSSRGRVPTLLRLNDDAYPVVGVYVQPARTSIAYAGLTGVLKQQSSFSTPHRPAQLVAKIRQKIEQLQKELSVTSIQTIAVALPGFVNAGTGRVSWSPLVPAYAGYDLAKELQQRTGIPVIADNDGNLGALSELRLSEAESKGKPEDFVLVSVGDFGLGAGIVIGGKIYRGHNSGFAGEFGHMMIDRNGEPCGCGRRGCLERFVSNEATWRRYRPDEPFERERFIELVHAARRGEADAVSALRETARYLSVGISNITFSLNPESVIMAGEITDAWDVIRGPIEETFASRWTSTALRRARLQGESSLLHGAVCLALSGVFARASLQAAEIGPETEKGPA